METYYLVGIRAKDDPTVVWVEKTFPYLKAAKEFAVRFCDETGNFCVIEYQSPNGRYLVDEVG